MRRSDGRRYGGERDWNERAFGEDWGERRGDQDFEERRFGGYGGYGTEMGRGREMRDWGMMDRDLGRYRERRMGRGPKNYTRSDERIKEDLCDRLSQHEWVDAREVEVQVQNGEVTLTGTVDDRRHKHVIEDIADDTFGVKDVHNQIRVQQGEMQQQSRTPTTPKQTPKA